jgi:uncharacterized membrane protein
MQTVIAVNFAEEAQAYEAMTKLKELDGQGRVGLGGAAVVVRDPDGHVETKDEVGDNGLEGTATGGIVGLIVGILGGPLGVLIGGATGLLIGSLYDMDDADETESVLSDISRSVRVGETSLLAELSEQSPEVVDGTMAGVGGTVLRRDLDDVRSEIAAAEDAQEAARKEARKALREERRAQVKEKIQAKIEELKAKLHRHPAGVAH